MSLSERLNAAKVGERAEPRPGDHDLATDAVDVGIPAPCPSCGGRGFLDLIDVRKRLQHEHCVECRGAWSRRI